MYSSRILEKFINFVLKREIYIFDQEYYETFVEEKEHM